MSRMASSNYELLSITDLRSAEENRLNPTKYEAAVMCTGYTQYIKGQRINWIVLTNNFASWLLEYENIVERASCKSQSQSENE
jgi:hypothetical protein